MIGWLLGWLGANAAVAALLIWRGHRRAAGSGTRELDHG